MRKNFYCYIGCLSICLMLSGCGSKKNHENIASKEETEVISEAKTLENVDEYNKYLSGKIFESDGRYLTTFENLNATYDYTNGVGEHYHYSYQVISIDSQQDEIILTVAKLKSDVTYDGSSIEDLESDDSIKKEEWTYNKSENSLDGYNYYGNTESTEIETAAPEKGMTQVKAQSILKTYLSSDKGSSELEKQLIKASKATTVKHVQVADIEFNKESNFEYDSGETTKTFWFYVKGNFYAHDDYGKLIDNYSFKLEATVYANDEDVYLRTAKIVE